MKKIMILSALIAVTAAFVILMPKENNKGASAEAEKNAVTLYTLMYHSLLKDPCRTGEYVMQPQDFENDLAYLHEHGYSTVTPQMIIDFAERGTPLPDKPVMLTFDDGHLNNMTYALPLLEKYDMTAVINVVGAYTLRAEEENDPNPYYAYLTRNDIRTLYDSGRFDIGCHTFDMHVSCGRRGASRIAGETEEDYKAAFSDDTDMFSELIESCGLSPTVYAYPFGFISKEGFGILKAHGYRIVLTCSEKPTVLSFDPDNSDDLVVINRFNRSGLVQTDEFMRSNDIS
ncbi:MAG: polysaccharide deacetylase family protein [Ruminococcus sp.]|nr:polysaccharide deacetylase family protein [Ruminococcus sp.]